jgi:hypothetical protein
MSAQGSAALCSSIKAALQCAGASASSVQINVRVVPIDIRALVGYNKV